MKSYNHLMSGYLSSENYMLAVKNATVHKSGSKRKYKKAQYFKENAEKLKPELLYYAEHFYNEAHSPKMIYDGIRRKQRYIIVPSMKEQIVHHMVVNVMKPIFMRTMYEHSYGSIPGRGGHKAKKQIEKWISNGDKNMKYCLKLDIKKFFDSIPHDILQVKLARLIHDADFLAILCKIINVTKVGLPLGFYTSQWFANWYLEELDHYIKEQLHVKYYVRYMDDMVLWGSNKKELHKVKDDIEYYLAENLGLHLKENWQVYLFDYVKKDGTHIGRDLDFMGFRFYRDRTILRRSIMLKATRKAVKLRKKKIKTIYDCRQMLSYLGWIDCTDTYNMYKKRIKPNVSFRSLRRKESNHQKMENRRFKIKCGIKQKTVAQQSQVQLTQNHQETMSTSERIM